MTPQALAWGWLRTFPARPFALLESAGPDWKRRFSLVAGEPLFVLEGRGRRCRLRTAEGVFALPAPPEAAFAALGRALAQGRTGGFWPLVHALSYEAGGRFERVPRAPAPAGGPGLPDWWAFLPGLWSWWEPARGRWRVGCAGLPAPSARRVGAALGLPERALAPARRAPEAGAGSLAAMLAAGVVPPPPSPPRAGGPATDSMGRDAFLRAVGAARGRIRAGDVYQANLAHHFSVPFAGDPFDLYRRLTRLNPSPMGAFVDLGEAQVVSASPERLFRLQGRRVETCPIAGTARRSGRPGERAALRRSPKDRAEHVMLVDLERNDLGRVCVPGSVRVREFMAVRSYRHVHHLVSRVVGTLRPGLALPDVLAAGFPGGSITGAPKIRCMEIIAALEGRSRGWYTGALGWWDPRAGRADLSILIRTLILGGGRAEAGVGAGVVLDSSAPAEWRETQDKGKALRRALGLRA